MVLNFGKYKHQHLSTINDRKYLEWVLVNVDNLSEEEYQSISNRIVSLPKYNSDKKFKELNNDRIQLLREILRHDLKEWDRNFINSVLKYNRYTEKQEVILKSIFTKYK